MKKPPALTREEIVAESTIADLKATNRHLLQQLARAKAKTQDLVAATYQAAREAAQTLALAPVKPPAPGARHRSPETAVALLADWQLAKRTPSYNTAVCEERVERYADRLLKLTAIQRADHPVPFLRVYLLGDLIEGELIFPGQAHRIDASLFSQVLVDGPRILGNFLRRTASHFERVHVVGVGGNHGCCHEDMRAVCRSGFTPWQELAPGMDIMSVDDDGNTIWQPIEEVIAYRYDGDLSTLDTRHICFALTPDHRVVGRAYPTATWVERRADDLIGHDHISMTCAGQNRLPDADISDEVIRLAGWSLTDAHRTRHGYWGYYQRPQKAHLIESVLTGLGLSFYRRERQRNISVICGKTLKVPPQPQIEFSVHAASSRIIDGLGVTRDRLPAWAWSLSRRQVDLLLQTLVEADGTKRDKEINYVVLNCSRQGLREDLQRLLVANGYRVTTKEYRPGHWRMNITAAIATVATFKQVEMKKYAGMVWCVRVPNGRFFVERAGRVHLTGNSLGGRARRDYHPESNADMMMYETTRIALGAQPNVTWAPNITAGERHWYAIDRIGPKAAFLLFHGDQIKGGFAGFPWYGFSKKLLRWQSILPDWFNYSAAGHFHTAVTFPVGRVEHYSAGSTESDNTWALEELGEQSRPTQWLLFVEPERIGVTAEYKVRLG